MYVQPRGREIPPQLWGTTLGEGLSGDADDDHFFAQSLARSNHAFAASWCREESQPAELDEGQEEGQEEGRWAADYSYDDQSLASRTAAAARDRMSAIQEGDDGEEEGSLRPGDRTMRTGGTVVTGGDEDDGSVSTDVPSLYGGSWHRGRGGGPPPVPHVSKGRMQEKGGGGTGGWEDLELASWPAASSGVQGVVPDYMSQQLSPHHSFVNSNDNNNNNMHVGDEGPRLVALDPTLRDEERGDIEDADRAWRDQDEDGGARDETVPPTHSHAQQHVQHGEGLVEQEARWYEGPGSFEVRPHYVPAVEAAQLDEDHRPGL